MRRGLDFPRHGGYFVLIDRPRQCPRRLYWSFAPLGTEEVPPGSEPMPSAFPLVDTIAKAWRRHRLQGRDEAAGYPLLRVGFAGVRSESDAGRRGSRRNRRRARRRRSAARIGTVRAHRVKARSGERRAPPFGHCERSLSPDGFRRSESAPPAQERTGTRRAGPRQQGGARPLPILGRAVFRPVLVQRPRGRQRDNLFLLPQQPRSGRRGLGQDPRPIRDPGYAKGQDGGAGRIQDDDPLRGPRPPRAPADQGSKGFRRDQGREPLADHHRVRSLALRLLHHLADAQAGARATTRPSASARAGPSATSSPRRKRPSPTSPAKRKPNTSFSRSSIT